MELKDQVCTLEQSKKLKELGVHAPSLFTWFGDETQRLVDNARDGIAVSNWVFISDTIPSNNQESDWRDDVCLKTIASAYTVAELGLMLPMHIGNPGTLPDSLISSYKAYGDGWFCTDNKCTIPADWVSHPTEAQARAAMLIYLLNNNLHTL